MSFSHAFSAYSNKELDELEQQFIQQINQSNLVIRDPLAVQYINHLSQRLSQHNSEKTAFFLVNSNEINAFAGPGGHIGVNSQLILASENESELAAVLAHEMAHVRQHHLYRMIEHQKQMRIPMLASMLASIALGVINPALASGALMGSLTGFAQDNINFVRSNEKEADRIGIDLLIKSGLDPRGMAGFFKKMQQNSRYYYTDNVPAILRTHPLDDERIAEAENRSQHIKRTSYPDNIDYHYFKELIRTLVDTDDKRLFDFYKQQCFKHNSQDACQYGLALTNMRMNDFKTAAENLKKLLPQQKNNLYIELAMLKAEIGNQEYQQASKHINELQANHPENYAIIFTHAQMLISNNQAPAAASLLLKASRKFKTDLPMCFALARAEALSQRQAYAYFTLAQCYELQGEHREAVRKLKLAKTMIKDDPILKLRIAAKIEEITSNYLD
jgi:beta-barrel assembly-enhancing protease